MQDNTIVNTIKKSILFKMGIYNILMAFEQLQYFHKNKFNVKFQILSIDISGYMFENVLQLQLTTLCRIITHLDGPDYKLSAADLLFCE